MTSGSANRRRLRASSRTKLAASPLHPGAIGKRTDGVFVFGGGDDGAADHSAQIVGFRQHCLEQVEIGFDGRQRLAFQRQIEERGGISFSPHRKQEKSGPSRVSLSVS